MNPTNDVFEKRIAALEGGIGALALASGAAAVTYAIQNIVRSGDHIVSASTLYGGTYNLFAHTLKDFGIDVSFVNPTSPAALRRPRSRTRRRTLSSPGQPQFQHHRHRGAGKSGA